MDYNSLAQIEYTKYDDSLGASQSTRQMINDIHQTLGLQRETMSIIAETMGAINASVGESHKNIMDRMNQPKTVIRDANGKIKGLV